MEGTVVYISADRLVDKATNTPYHVVHVRMSSKALRKAGDLKLQAGRPAEVLIQTAGPQRPAVSG